MERMISKESVKQEVGIKENKAQKDLGKARIRCLKNISKSLSMASDDMAEDLELDVRLKDGEVLCCRRCREKLLGPANLRIRSDCKASKKGEHDFVVVGDLSEITVYSCFECGNYWGATEVNLEELRKEPCEKSVSGVHNLKKHSYVSGQQKFKPVVPKEAPLFYQGETDV